MQFTGEEMVMKRLSQVDEKREREIIPSRSRFHTAPRCQGKSDWLHGRKAPLLVNVWLECGWWLGGHASMSWRSRNRRGVQLALSAWYRTWLGTLGTVPISTTGSLNHNLLEFLRCHWLDLSCMGQYEIVCRYEDEDKDRIPQCLAGSSHHLGYRGLE
jgi:hypothetical protein